MAQSLRHLCHAIFSKMFRKQLLSWKKPVLFFVLLLGSELFENSNYRCFFKASLGKKHGLHEAHFFREPVYDFLLVININLAPLLRYSDLLAKNRKLCLSPSHLASLFGVTSFEFMEKL